MGEECSLDVLRLDHDPAEDFGDCVCQSGPGYTPVYLIIRDLIVLYQFGMLVADFVTIFTDKKLKLYIFFDFWTQALLFLSSEMGIYGIVRRCSDESDYENAYWDYMPWYCSVYWALFSAALPSSTLSCIFYWTDLYKKGDPVVHIMMNSVSTFVSILEFVLAAFPLRLLNFFYFVIFYFIYVMFTLVYQKRGGTGVGDMVPIYKAVDWRDPKKAAFNCVFGLAIGLGCYFIFCSVSMAKTVCRNKYLFM